jgi:hypothetical protein
MGSINYLEMIPVPEEVPTTAIVERAFELCRPTGVSELHYGPQGLLDGEAQTLVNHYSYLGVAVQIQVLKGRPVYLIVFRDESTGVRYLPKAWMGHTRAQLVSLLESCRIPFEKDEIMGEVHGL